MIDKTEQVDTLTNIMCNIAEAVKQFHLKGSIESEIATIVVTHLVSINDVKYKPISTQESTVNVRWSADILDQLREKHDKNIVTEVVNIISHEVSLFLTDNNISEIAYIRFEADSNNHIIIPGFKIIIGH